VFINQCLNENEDQKLYLQIDPPATLFADLFECALEILIRNELENKNES